VFDVSTWSGRLYAVACAAMFVFGKRRSSA
jgi:hypothetical protein